MKADATFDALIAEAVASGPWRAIPEGPHTWGIAREAGLRRATVRHEDRWLTAETGVEDVTRGDTLWDRLLRGRNAEIGRLVALSGGNATCCRSELWLGESPDPAAIPGVRAWIDAFTGNRPLQGDEGHRMSADDFRSVCLEARVDCAGNEGFPEWVALPDPFRAERAWIGPDGAGFGVSAEVCRLDAQAAVETREAVALLVLTVSGMVRRLGAAAWPGATGSGGAAGKVAIRLESRLPPVPEPDELGRVLGALSTGLRLAGAEADALADIATARAYLAAHDSQSTVRTA